MEIKDAVLILLVGVVIGMLVIMGLAAGSGRNYYISEPITDLESGKVYEVRGLTREVQNCFLLLKADDEIKFYKLLSADVPTDLESGDGLVKLSTGLKRLPHEFS